ncbi:MAG: AAA family ATPase [Methylobacter sp.]|nr:AAA family ATPase [Methylobacter sp.]
MLNSLEIKNFRALDDFKVAKLGRVNLIVGKNNSGKSTVLEALRIYAGNAQRELLVDIAQSHDETYQLAEVKFGDLNPAMPFEDLFTGRRFPDDDTVIVIGESADSSQALRIIYRISIDDNELKEDVEGSTDIQREPGLLSRQSRAEDVEGLTDIQRRPGLLSRQSRAEDVDSLTDIQRSGFGQAVTKEQYINLVRKRGADFVTKREKLILIKNKKAISIFLSDKFSTDRSYLLHEGLGLTPCSFIPTQLISIDELAKEWDNIVGTEHEDVVKQALRIILPELDNIYFVQNNKAASSPGGSQRTAKIKLPNLPRPVPLKSLGDGMIRILQLALKLVSAQGGFLLIDELENGLHYSIQEEIWAWLFKVAERLDIQVFATTHSWDCIENFTKVAIANETIEGVLFRMGKSARTSNRGQIIATVYDKDSLHRLTQAEFEIR